MRKARPIVFLKGRQVFMDENALVLYDKAGAVAKITLNRPKARNALSRALIRGLSDALDAACADDGVHVVVLAAAGEKAFSAGFDIKESISDPSSTSSTAAGSPTRNSVRGARSGTAKNPSSPRCRATASAGGCISRSCATHRRVRRREVRRAGAGLLLRADILIEPWKLPMNKARELLYLGEYLSAQELFDCGVVNRVVPFAELETTAMALAEKIAAMPADAVQMLKYQLNKTYEMQGMTHAMDFAKELFNLCRINQAQTQETFNKIVREEGLTAALASRQ
jgi:enoyl-CoA hydratase